MLIPSTRISKYAPTSTLFIISPTSILHYFLHYPTFRFEQQGWYYNSFNSVFIASPLLLSTLITRLQQMNTYAFIWLSILWSNKFQYTDFSANFQTLYQQFISTLLQTEPFCSKLGFKETVFLTYNVNIIQKPSPMYKPII